MHASQVDFNIPASVIFQILKTGNWGGSGFKLDNAYGNRGASFFTTGGNDAIDFTLELPTGNKAQFTFTRIGSELMFQAENAVDGEFHIIVHGEVLAVFGVNKSWIKNQPIITSGTADPSGGNDGDIYLKFIP